jgi:hypothetical protein
MLVAGKTRISDAARILGGLPATELVALARDLRVHRSTIFRWRRGLCLPNAHAQRQLVKRYSQLGLSFDSFHQLERDPS